MNYLTIVFSLNLKLSIDVTLVGLIFVFLVIPNIDAFKTKLITSLFAREELASVLTVIIIGFTSTNSISWENSNNSLNIELDNHVPEALEAFILRSLTCNNKTIWGIWIISLLSLAKGFFLKGRFDDVCVQVCKI